jgi:hypothetical protein
MKKPASAVAAIVFWFIALAQLLRVILRVRVTAGNHDIPLWLSSSAFVILGIWGSGCGANVRRPGSAHSQLSRE